MNPIFNARIYYRRLTTWTRAYLLSKYFGIGNADEIFGWLYLESLHIGNLFWFEFITWVRNYMLSRYKGLGNSEAIYARLQQVLIDVADAMKKIFGDQFQDTALLLLNNYINLIDGLITASMDENYNEVDRITRLLYMNAGE